MRKYIAVALLFIPSLAFGQAWSGIIDPTRATDWSTVGVSGGIPNRQTNCVTAACNTLFGGSVTATTIQNALASAPANTVVRIPAGTFTVGTFVFSQDNITLRGAGATTTTLNMSTTQTSCGNGFINAAVIMCKGNFNYPGGGGPAPDHTATWTGTAGTASGGSTGANLYPQGATQITVSSTTGIVANQTVIHLDQLNDASDGWPVAGAIYICDGTAPCSAEGGGSAYRSNRAQNVGHLVTGIAGSTLTIDPPLNLPNWRISQAPGAWWGDTAHIQHDSGIEDLTINFTGGNQVGIETGNTYDVWLKGVALINTSGTAGSFVLHYIPLFATRTTIRDSYFYGPTAQGNTQYTVAPYDMSFSLVENNIFHRNVIPIVPNDPSVGNVYGYNFFTGGFYTGASVQLHTPADMMSLFEGNNGPSYLGDDNHGPHYFNTLFRNLNSGHRYNPSGNVDVPIELLVHNRFFNIVGNVLGDSTYITSYQSINCNSTTGCSQGNPIYVGGWIGNCSFCTGLTADTFVMTTLMRWGNWDTVTSTNDTGTNDQTGTRWCGNSSDTGWSTTCASTSEVPTGIANFANAVPAAESLPNSFYLSAKPAWFGAVAWPPMGFDVANGNITSFGGHANKIPAQLCYESLGGPLAGNGSPLAFNASTCYAVASVPTNGPRGNIQVQGNFAHH